MTSPLAVAIACKHPEIDEATVDTVTRAVVLEIHMLAVEHALCSGFEVALATPGDVMRSSPSAR